jgi:hypothetical protein
MPADETPRQPEARHSESYPAQPGDAQLNEGLQRRPQWSPSAGECGDPIWEYDAVEDEYRESPGYDPHAATNARAADRESGIQGRIVELGPRRERREQREPAGPGNRNAGGTQ